MLRLISGFRASRVVYVAARLRLIDALRDEPMDAPMLATVTATHAPSLERLLRALASLGVLAHLADGRFAVTAQGATLDSRAPGSLRAWAELALGGEHYAAWGEIEHGVRYGEVAFEHLFGMDVWAFREQDRERGECFDQAMAALTRAFDPGLTANAAFGGVRTLVDVGGGDGSLLLSLLEQQPQMQGVLFDLPRVVVDAQRKCGDAREASRCRFVAGDMFDRVPAGADGYLLSRILHDWDDARAATILDNCRRAVAPSGKLWVIERLLPERFEVSPAAQSAALADLAMMVMTGGRERTADEFRSLLERAGFALRRVEAMPSGVALIEAFALP
jgi:hypothetical protein